LDSFLDFFDFFDFFDLFLEEDSELDDEDDEALSPIASNEAGAPSPDDEAPDGKAGTVDALIVSVFEADLEPRCPDLRIVTLKVSPKSL
jgi:hypothetical protein